MGPAVFLIHHCPAVRVLRWKSGQNWGFKMFTKEQHLCQEERDKDRTQEELQYTPSKGVEIPAEGFALQESVSRRPQGRATQEGSGPARRSLQGEGPCKSWVLGAEANVSCSPASCLGREEGRALPFPAASPSESSLPDAPSTSLLLGENFWRAGDVKREVGSGGEQVLTSVRHDGSQSSWVQTTSCWFLTRSPQTCARSMEGET